MSTQGENQIIINKYPLSRVFTILMCLIGAVSLILGAALANCAQDVLAGSRLGALLGKEADNWASLGIFAIGGIACLFVLYLRNAYQKARSKGVRPTA